MRNATKQASLTASLLHRAPRPSAALSGGFLAAKPSVPVEAPQAHLFCRKGEASAEGFRSLRYPSSAPVAPTAEPVPAAPQPAAALPKCGQGRRLWLRIGADRRALLKQAASANGRTCQAFLVGALDAFLGEVAGPSGIEATSLLVVPKPAAYPAAPAVPSARVKLACWVDEERRAKTLLAAGRLGQTVQSFLETALDKQLGRMASTREEPPVQGSLALDPAPPLLPIAGLSLLVAAGLVKGAAAFAQA